MKPRWISALALTVSAAQFVSCSNTLVDSDRMHRGTGGVATLSVTLTDTGSHGTPGAPLPFSAAGVSFTLRIEAHGADGNIATGFEGFVGITATPGTLQGIAGDGLTISGRNVQLTHGVADGVQVTVGSGFGETRIWAEESGYVPADPNRQPPPQCADGIDNNHNGRIDFPSDYGCAAPNDDSEEGGSYAAAASDAIYFDTPTISDVRGTGASSPLLNARVTINRGTLIVTRVDTSGFWVTDTSAPMCPDPRSAGAMRHCANSLFAFNFSLPAGIRPCDRLDEVQGTVAQFVGDTQLSQPSWIASPTGLFIDDPMNPQVCPIPDADEIRPSDLADSNTASQALQPYQNGLVRLSNVVFPTKVGPALACDMMGANCDFHPGQSSCDLGHTGTVDFRNPAQAACANACQRTLGCSEWTAWQRFAQLTVDFAMGAGTAVRMAIAPKNAFSSFDPLRPPVPAGQPIFVTGTLKQVGPNYIVEPRCTQDVFVPTADMPTPPPARATCVTPRPIPDQP